MSCYEPYVVKQKGQPWCACVASMPSEPRCRNALPLRATARASIL